MSRTVYESCGFRVVPGKGDVFGNTFDILKPDGSKLTSVGSVQGYKRVIRKAAGLDRCTCGHIVGNHFTWSATPAFINIRKEHMPAQPGGAKCSACDCAKSPSTVQRELRERERRLNERTS